LVALAVQPPARLALLPLRRLHLRLPPPVPLDLQPAPFVVSTIPSSLLEQRTIRRHLLSCDHQPPLAVVSLMRH
jgi:hypothetical protein